MVDPHTQYPPSLDRPDCEIVLRLHRADAIDAGFEIGATHRRELHPNRRQRPARGQQPDECRDERQASNDQYQTTLADFHRRLRSSLERKNRLLDLIRRVAARAFLQGR